MHWTFALLLLWIGIAHLWRGSNYVEAVYGVAFILAIFACVVLHELGHALTARRFGIETQDYAKATSIAASVGQTLAIVLGILGLFGNALLVLVAAFVYLGAAGESRMVQLTEALRGLTVRDAMMRRFRTLTSDAALSRAADELLLGHQRDFPVASKERGRAQGTSPSNRRIASDERHALRNFIHRSDLNTW